MPEEAPPDQDARHRIARDLDATLFVEAGAGSGKTTALVERVVALVTTGTAEIRSIAAITFTERAGAQLRDRVRTRLTSEAGRDPGGAGAARCRVGLDQLDGAAIGTLHSFAQRILSEHPIEAGLPPRVEVLDEVSSGVEFERRWSVYRDALLVDPHLERTLLLLFASGVKSEALRSLAVAFDQNWDLVAERVPEHAPDPPPVQPQVEAALTVVDEVLDDRIHCTDPDDKLLARLDEIAGDVVRLRAITGEIDLLEALAFDAPVKLAGFSVGNLGSRANWNIDVRALKTRVRDAGDALDGVRSRVSEACAIRLGAAIRGFTLGAAAERQGAGRLDFHDLLVLSRALLRDPDRGPRVRARLHVRYDRLLLDEFQDTDPIQIELAVRIAAADPTAAATGTAEWDQIAVAPGHLFVVGDPKQSIYRFRRADIATFMAAEARFGPDAGGVVDLTANFRTVAPVIDCINRTFATLMASPPGVDGSIPSQPPYVALDAVRAAAPDGPPVSVLGRNAHPATASADEMRAAESAEVAATVVGILDAGWDVADGGGRWRRAGLGDITVLVPSRTSLPFLEDALDSAGVAYRAESASLVYATRAVRDLLMVLRAVDDPTDHLRVVAALRTPLLGCGDDDLFRFKVQRHGHWDHLARQPDTVPVDDPVRVGLAYLRSLYDQRFWLAPSELLDRIARDRRALEIGFAERRARDVWRRLRFVIDQARAWSDATGGTLRQYLHWIDQQTAEGARVAEAVLPETDDDAVRIMTIHAAKGLEFAITIVSGLSTVPGGQRAPAEVVFPREGNVGYKFGRAVKTTEYTAQEPIDEQMGYHERVRLLYVACTRACDHLVVSLHRKTRANVAADHKRTNAELLFDGMATMLDGLPDVGGDDGPARLLPAPADRPEPPRPMPDWAAERTAALASARRPSAVAATALTDEGTPDADREPDPGLEKRPRDLDLPPWLKGRYGTAVGRAVHGVLQTIDLATGAGLDAAVAAQSEAEAVPDRAGDVRLLVGYALVAPSVVAAAARPHWREVYACTPVDGDRLLEGYIDLLYRVDDGLVVVDYKTASSDDPGLLDLRVAGYRRQGASYALAVGAATDEPVIRVTFVFLTPSGAVERHLTDLPTAVGDVRALVLSGREVTLD